MTIMLSARLSNVIKVFVKFPDICEFYDNNVVCKNEQYYDGLCEVFRYL